MLRQEKKDSCGLGMCVCDTVPCMLAATLESIWVFFNGIDECGLYLRNNTLLSSHIPFYFTFRSSKFLKSPNTEIQSLHLPLLYKSPLSVKFPMVLYTGLDF